jgi:hypothetical protein
VASSLTTGVVPDPACPALVIYLLYVVFKVPVVGTTLHLQAVKCTTGSAFPKIFLRGTHRSWLPTSSTTATRRLERRTGLGWWFYMGGFDPPLESRLASWSGNPLGGGIVYCLTRSILPPMTSTGKATVTVTLGELQIWLSQDGVYPDQVTDLCSRAAVLFGTALAQVKATGINVMSPDGEDGDEEDEDA